MIKPNITPEPLKEKMKYFPPWGVGEGTLTLTVCLLCMCQLFITAFHEVDRNHILEIRELTLREVSHFPKF